MVKLLWHALDKHYPTIFKTQDKVPLSGQWVVSPFVCWPRYSPRVADKPPVDRLAGQETPLGSVRCPQLQTVCRPGLLGFLETAACRDSCMSWGQLKGLLGVLGTPAGTLAYPGDNCSDSKGFRGYLQEFLEIQGTAAGTLWDRGAQLSS